MAFVDPEIIHRLEEERALKLLQFEPATVNVLEINLFAVRSLFLRVFDVPII
jgi:hypothetical protein